MRLYANMRVLERLSLSIHSSENLSFHPGVNISKRLLYVNGKHFLETMGGKNGVKKKRNQWENS